jgi:hypothetical protein
METCHHLEEQLQKHLVVNLECEKEVDHSTVEIVDIHDPFEYALEEQVVDNSELEVDLGIELEEVD